MTRQCYERKKMRFSVQNQLSMRGKEEFDTRPTPDCRDGEIISSFRVKERMASQARDSRCFLNKIAIFFFKVLAIKESTSKPIY